jgi:cytochrome P450/NADPH-cytochrome P450 reductase
MPWLYHPEGFMARMLQLLEQHRDAGAIRVPLPTGHSPIFVGNVDLATDVLDEARFEKVLEGPLVHIRDFAGDGLFTAHSHEENWHRAHRILTPGFSSASIDRYYPAMVESLQALCAHWRRATGPVDVVLDMTRLTLDTISLAGFAHRFESFDRPTLHPFLQALARALQESIDALRRPPFLFPLFRATRARYRQDIATMFSLVDEVIQQRKQRPRADWPSDFLSLMLDAPDPGSGERLSDENIRYQILTFLIAGHETTAGLLAFALHQLALDPALLQRVRAEVDALGHGRMPSMKEVLGLDLTRRVLSETLRLWPTVPAITRAARADTSLAGRIRVPRGQPLGLLISAMHRDPTVWPDPSRFDPDRFLPGPTRARPAAAYKPFGVGKRACTGRHFALVEATLCLAVLVRDFELGPVPPLTLAPTVSPKPRGFFLRVTPRRGAT